MSASAAASAAATLASTPVPLLTVTSTLVSKERVGSSAHSTSRKRSLSRCSRRLPVGQSSVCTTKPSPLPK